VTERKQSANERKQAHELESALSELQKKNKEQEAVVAALREKGLKLLVYAALSYLCIRSSATSV